MSFPAQRVKFRFILLLFLFFYLYQTKRSSSYQGPNWGRVGKAGSVTWPQPALPDKTLAEPLWSVSLVSSPPSGSHTILKVESSQLPEMTPILCWPVILVPATVGVCYTIDKKGRSLEHNRFMDSQQYATIPVYRQLANHSIDNQPTSL